MGGIASLADAKIEIRAMDHDVQEVTQKNFDSVVSKFRDSQIASVYFFKPNDKEDTFTMYNEVAKELKGMAKITGINCEAWPAFCKEHGAEETPMIKLFPLNPMPAYKYAGDMKKEKLVKALSKMIPNFVTDLTSDAADNFLVSDPSKPKVLLFSDKEKIPTKHLAQTSMWLLLSAPCVSSSQWVGLSTLSVISLDISWAFEACCRISKSQRGELQQFFGSCIQNSGCWCWSPRAFATFFGMLHFLRSSVFHLIGFCADVELGAGKYSCCIMSFGFYS